MTARGLGALVWQQQAYSIAQGQAPGCAGERALQLHPWVDRWRGLSAASRAGPAAAGSLASGLAGCRGLEAPREVCLRAAASSQKRSRVRARESAPGAVAAAAVASFTGVLHRLRSVRSEERRAILAQENEQGLVMISVGLRLKRRGKKSGEELVALIEETLAQDEAAFHESKPIGKLARILGRYPNPDDATNFIVSQKKLTVDKLKSMCKELRLPVTGKKAVLAKQFTEELREIWKFINLEVDAAPPAAGGADAPQEEVSAEAVVEQEPAAAVEEEHAAAQQPAVEASYASGEGQALHAGVSEAYAAPAYGYAEQQGAAELPPHEDRSAHQGAYPAEYAAPGVVEAEAVEAETVEAPGQYAEAFSQQGEWRQDEAQGAAVEAEVSWADNGASAHPGAQYAEEGYAAASYAAATPVPVEAAQVDVVETQTIADAATVQEKKREKRKAERRMKLMGYLVEEVATIYGGEKDRYMADMKSMLQEVPDEARMAYCSDKLEEPTAALVAQRVPSVLGEMPEAPEFGAWHSEPHQYQMHMVGEVGPSRQAWCKWWDSNTGCGELVDLVDSNPVAVVSAALSTGANVSPRLKYLRQGEFVEYRRVERGGELIARAVLVRGIKGWPLMCEVDTSRVLEE